MLTSRSKSWKRTEGRSQGSQLSSRECREGQRHHSAPKVQRKFHSNLHLQRRKGKRRTSWRMRLRMQWLAQTLNQIDRRSPSRISLWTLWWHQKLRRVKEEFWSRKRTRKTTLSCWKCIKRSIELQKLLPLLSPPHKVLSLPKSNVRTKQKLDW